MHYVIVSFSFVSLLSPFLPLFEDDAEKLSDETIDEGLVKALFTLYKILCFFLIAISEGKISRYR